jgi:hypothetical protein
MVKSISFLLAIFCSVSTFAKEISIAVQCHATGPVFNGTLSFPIDLNSWKKKSCEKYQENVFELVFESEITFRINGLEYRSPSANHNMYAVNCEPNSFWDYIGDRKPHIFANLSENTSSYKLNLDINLSEKDLLKGSIWDGDRECFFKEKL